VHQKQSAITLFVHGRRGSNEDFNMKESLKLVAVTILLQGCTVLSNPISCPQIGATYNATTANGQNLRLDTRGPIGRFGELSGLGFSPTQKGPSGDPAIFSFADGDSGERLGMWDSKTGERMMTFQIRNTTTINWDWEAMTIGSCGNTGESDTCIYIGDLGDNTARVSGGDRTQRTSFIPRILKIKEPMLEDFEDTDYIPESYISILTIDYLHSTSPTEFADVEAIFVDHTGWGEGGTIGDIYLVSKWDRNRNRYLDLTRLFKIPPSAWPDKYDGATAHFSPFAVGYYDWKGEEEASGRYTYVTDGQLMGMPWRGGEMSYDGTLIALTTTKNSTIFLRCPGVSVADTLAAPAAETKYCRLWDQPTGRSQVETIAFSPDGKRSLSIPEGHRPRMGWTEFDYTDTSQVCPETAPPPTDVPTSTPPPTGVPTRTPTTAPTRLPSRAPTRSPTQKPSSSHSEAPTMSPTMTQSVASTPTSFAELTMVGNRVGGLSMCEADCDSDFECDEGLICYSRSKGSPSVPGCSGNADEIGDGNEDFCIFPVVQMAGDGKDGLSVCQADCDSNADCEGDLVCYQRSKWSMSSVPGCSGNVNEIGNGGEDFCIVASASFAALAMVAIGLDGMQVCQGDCDRNSDCAGSLVCYQRSKGISLVPGCRGDADDFGDGSEDFCVHPLALAPSGLKTAAHPSDPSRETTGLIVAVCIVGALLIGTLIVYFKFCKRPQPTMSKSGRESEDNSIDMQTAATSLGASKAQTEGDSRGMYRNQVEGKPSANSSHCGMTGLINL
jgi:hypothetical protein